MLTYSLTPSLIFTLFSLTLLAFIITSPTFVPTPLAFGLTSPPFWHNAVAGLSSITVFRDQWEAFFASFIMLRIGALWSRLVWIRFRCPMISRCWFAKRQLFSCWWQRILWALHSSDELRYGTPKCSKISWNSSVLKNHEVLDTFQSIIKWVPTGVVGNNNNPPNLSRIKSDALKLLLWWFQILVS